jgi:hypothetical protein
MQSMMSAQGAPGVWVQRAQHGLMSSLWFMLVSILS